MLISCSACFFFFFFFFFSLRRWIRVCHHQANVHWLCSIYHGFCKCSATTFFVAYIIGSRDCCSVSRMTRTLYILPFCFCQLTSLTSFVFVVVGYDCFCLALSSQPRHLVSVKLVHMGFALTTVIVLSCPLRLEWACRANNRRVAGCSSVLLFASSYRLCWGYKSCHLPS